MIDLKGKEICLQHVYAVSTVLLPPVAKTSDFHTKVPLFQPVSFNEIISEYSWRLFLSGRVNILFCRYCSKCVIGGLVRALSASATVSVSVVL